MKQTKDKTHTCLINAVLYCTVHCTLFNAVLYVLFLCLKQLFKMPTTLFTTNCKTLSLVTRLQTSM